MEKRAGGMWDPRAYLRFGDERARPFADLLSRVRADEPGFVVDLGCGPGHLTAALAARWPAARVLGVDNSPEMIEAAQAARAGGLEFRLADIRTWQPGRPVDVITCNAVLQWIPGHEELLTGWVRWLAPGGWLAFQLPGNFDQPSHTIMRELAGAPRWRSLLDGAQLNRQAGDPAGYLALLAGVGCDVNAWETTYLHVLPGEDAVVNWYRGSGLRPVLAALPPALAEEFVAAYRDRVQAAYPAAPYGTVLPFRRVFVVARVRASTG